MATPGWQQPAVPKPPSPRTCVHLGVLIASLGMLTHPEGHEWVCTCGQVFKVVSNGGRDKRLEKTNEVRTIKKGSV